jgi:glucose-6-phosphate dehydrogenase assembly protein OpcA
VAADLTGRPAPGTIPASGTRTAGGRIEPVGPARPGEPQLRWQSRATTIDDIEKELSRIWAPTALVSDPSQEGATRQMAARTSVMNLVVVAGDHETGARAAETISRLTGRHPSRTLIVLIADPDGPPWLDGRIQAHCMLPRPDAPESCTEMVYLTAGGETGRHLAALVTPLLVHDLPVTTWWPGEPPLGSDVAEELLAQTDRLVVDGSTWRGDGLARLGAMAALFDRYPRISIRDFGFVRQSRWREAIATVFDLPDFAPYLGYVRRVSVTYATRDETGAPGSTNVVKPLYHVAWLASRLGFKVMAPLAPVAVKGPAPRLRPGEKPPLHRGLAARLRDPRAGEVGVVIRPVASAAPAGTTLRVEILAERRGSELRADVTAEAENVHVHAWLDGVEALDRTFKAPRRGDIDLLAEALEGSGRDPVAQEAIRMAAGLSGAWADIAPSSA